MTLLKRSNGGLVPFRSLFSDIFDGDGFVDEKFWNKNWVPAVNVSENDKTYEIEVTAPGMKKTDFKVQIEKGTLTISAERKEEKEEKKKNYTRQELLNKRNMKAYTKTKSKYYQNVTIEDEIGLETFSVRKNLFFAQLASHLRQISTTVTPAKTLG